MVDSCSGNQVEDRRTLVGGQLLNRLPAGQTVGQRKCRPDSVLLTLGLLDVWTVRVSAPKTAQCAHRFDQSFYCRPQDHVYLM